MPRFDLGLVHYHFVFLALCISKCIITWIDFLNPPHPPPPQNTMATFYTALPTPVLIQLLPETNRTHSSLFSSGSPLWL